MIKILCLFLSLVSFLAAEEEAKDPLYKNLNISGNLSFEAQLSPGLPTLFLRFENKGAEDVKIDLALIYETERFFKIVNLENQEEMGHSPAGSPEKKKYGAMTLSAGARLVLVLPAPYNLIFTEPEEGKYSLSHSKFGLVIKSFEVRELLHNAKIK